ncbi:MAG: protein kinase [Deltaproteobacteria bacterium]|nr:protein kinase [Deltaproteobacteria bacterium]
MALSHHRVVKVGETLYPHEQEGIDFAISALPDTSPYHLWALIDLLDPTTGRLNEIDLLVLGYSCLYLIELKAFSGRMEGDSVDWTWTTPDGKRMWRENPLRLTRRKAQILKSRLERALPSGMRAPWIEPLVFLSNERIELALQPDGIIGVVRRDNFANAIMRHDFPGAIPRPAGQRIDGPQERAVVQALAQIGVRPRKGKYFVGPYELGELLGETSAFQDRVATHRDLKGLTRRARTYLVPEQTSVERRQQLRRAADREAQLLFEVGGHPNILTYADYVTDAPLGPTVLLEAFDDGVPLDTFLRQAAPTFAERIAIIEQVGRALHHCHKKSVVHGGLCPSAVLVRRHPDTKAIDTRLFNFQLGKGESVTGTSHATDLAAEAWALYQAPELGSDSGERTVEADIFSLGAVAFLVITGKEPAASVTARAEALRTRRCLDPRAVDDTVPGEVADRICFATEDVVASRADDAGAWVEMLLEAVTAPVAERPPEISPLEARAEDMIGPYLVKGVLGHGASARVLEVIDNDGRELALKVSLGPEHDERLRAEAAVLDRLNHPRIVRLVATHTFADRTCLLLTLAGTQTLHRELADKGTVSLDYASRWGEDLLSAIAHLEEHEVVHRDIKPANLGVGTTSAKKARTLHLYDFSLASSPITELRVGTAAYRDPFLPDRRMWDHAADRYSAAVTLHEILTGVRPTRRDDGTLEVAAERFDPSARAALIAFFARALLPVAADRFETADDMRHAWIACFGSRAVAEAPVVATEPEPIHLSDDDVRAIAPDTAIAALPLSTRARNALDRAGLLVAGGLLSLPDNRLSAIRGVGRDVAREIHEFRTRWQTLRPLEAERGAAFFPGYRGADLMVATALTARDAAVLTDAGLHTLALVASAPASHVMALASHRELDAAAVTARLRQENQVASERDQPTTLEAWVDVLFAGKSKQSQHVRALMGLDGPFAGRLDVTPRMVADHLGYTLPPIYVALTKARQAWAAHPALPALIDRIRGHVRDQGGAAPLDAAAEWLLAELPHDASIDATVRQVQAAAVLRAIAEVDKEDDDGIRFARLANDRPWLLTSADLTGELRDLGRLADRLADRDVLAGPSEADRALREALAAESPLLVLPADRLVRLAAAASDHAAASPRLELYPRGMAAARALELSALALGAKLSPDDLPRLVAARYPAAAALPPRPALDVLVRELVGLDFDPGKNLYARPGAALATTNDTRHRTLLHTSQLTPQSISEREVENADFDERIRTTLERRSLLVLGVPTDLSQAAAAALARIHGLTRHSFDARFLAALDALVAAQEIDPAVVIETDAEGPRADAWRLLTSLSEDAAAQVASALLPPKQPILITEPGLIHRYHLDGFLRGLVAASQNDASAAIILLCPGHGGQRGRAPTIEGELAVPGLLPGQSAWIPLTWLNDNVEKRTSAA